MSNQNQNTTGKAAFTALLQEVFAMIEELNINEGLYLQFADLFKQMNMNIERLSAIRQEVIVNRYYQRYVRNTPDTLVRQRLTEEQKRRSPHYSLCDCGRYIAISFMREHINTMVHFQGRRNRKYAGKGIPDPIITENINREVVLHDFTIKHIQLLSQQQA
jgi:hypothetical protein